MLLLMPTLAHATPDHAHELERWWLAWNFDPLIVGNLLLVGGLYTVGVARLWGRAGGGRGVARWQVGMFGLGMLALVAALVSPIDIIAGELGWVHMVQHMLLMVVAAPLLVLGSPGVVAFWSLPGRWRRRLSAWWPRPDTWRSPRYWLWQPAALWVIYAVTLWVWHVPDLYEAALHDDLVHDAQHLTFLVAACLYWRILMDPIGRVRLTPTLGVIYLFTTMLHATLLGVFMALAPTVWYPYYETTAPRWNLTALEDQQLAGYIMWMPACATYVVVAAGIFFLWLSETERRDSESVTAPAT